MDAIDITDTTVADIDSSINIGLDDNSMIDDMYNELPTDLDNSHLASIIISLDINNA